jgi:hypothetical protein
MGAHLLHNFPCKKCGKPFKCRRYDYERGFKSYCGKDCYNATRPRGFGNGGISGYERKIASERRNPIQSAARKQMDQAIRSGRLKRRPCVICNDPKTEGHHHDYAKPLDVYFLCRKHHVAVHDGEIHLPSFKEPDEPPKAWPRGRRCRPRTKPA